jgi:branched-chain amino acid transport system permease protein
VGDLIVVLLYGLVQGSIYVLIGMGITLTFGVTHILNFAHGELVTLGAFGVILMAPQIGVVPAILVTLIGVTVLSGLAYQTAFRFTVGNHLTGLMLSLAILLVAENYLSLKLGTNPREGPSVSGVIEIFGSRIGTARLVVLAVMVPVVAAVWLTLKKTWIGISLRACSDDPLAAASVGMAAKRVGFYSFAVGGALAAIAGVAMSTVLAVTPQIGASFVLKGFVVVVIGGLGSPVGALVAGLALGVFESFVTRYVDPSYTTIYAFALMIAVLLVAPEGLFNRKARRV